ncbi:nucleotidyltransferase domain-containing protein [Candidatus Poribacteria bacterium]|nr:nucleotidyltransferase domain-containing protein [Candidatus Poribacteria bacterium]
MFERDLRIAETFKRLVERRVPVRRILAFGSRAKGNAGPESDLDLFVEVEQRTPEIREYISHCAWEAGFDEGVVVTTVVFTREELENTAEGHSPLVKNVLREGIAV